MRRGERRSGDYFQCSNGACEEVNENAALVWRFIAVVTFPFLLTSGHDKATWFIGDGHWCCPPKGPLQSADVLWNISSLTVMNFLLKIVLIGKKRKKKKNGLNKDEVTSELQQHQSRQLRKKKEWDRMAYNLDEVMLNLYLAADRQKWQ